MKILIAYDGSEPSDEALAGLARAGLPAKAEAMILSAADIWLMDGDGRMAVNHKEHFDKVVKSAQKTAQKAGTKIHKKFPAWTINILTPTESPAMAILDKAERWKADLIAMGSHGRSTLGRIRWGSVSQSVATHAHCSVRIGRAGKKTNRKGLRILIGLDGSAHSERVIKTVSARKWPPGTEVRVITVFDPSLYTTGVVINIEAEQQYEWFTQTVKAAQTKLMATGLKATGTVLGGNPKHVLLHEAEKWGADCVFVGAKGTSRVNRLLFGSVSSALAMRARCSVEIVR